MNENFIDLSKCTIVIPTYNRSQYLKRLLKYYSTHAPNTKIIVADSSIPVKKIANRKIIELISKLSINYIDTFSVETNVFYKIEKALTFVTTQYVVLCADDDFIIPKMIRKCVIFLDNKPDFIAVQGKVLTYCLDNDKISQSKINWGDSYPQYSIINEYPIDRVHNQLSEYKIATMYAVHRTNVLLHAVKVSNLYSEDLRFGEILISLISLIKGKFASINGIYSVRETNLQSDSQTLGKIDNFIANNTFHSKYKLFKQALINSLGNDYNIAKLNLIIDDSMKNYLRIHHLQIFLKYAIEPLILTSFRITKHRITRFIKSIFMRYNIPKISSPTIFYQHQLPDELLSVRSAILEKP